MRKAFVEIKRRRGEEGDVADRERKGVREETGRTALLIT